MLPIYRLLDVFRDRLDYPDLKRKAVELYERWSPCTVLIEDHGSGTSLIQDLKREKNVWPAPLQVALSSCRKQSASTYPASGRDPGQDGDTHVMVLIRFTASNAIF